MNSAARPSSSSVPVTGPANAAFLAALEYHLIYQEDDIQPHDYPAEKLAECMYAFQAEIMAVQPRAMAEMEEVNVLRFGYLVLGTLDALLHSGRWMDTVQYLAKCVKTHVEDSVIAPVNPFAPDLVKIHRELFLYLHRQHIWELLGNGSREAARQHFIDHVGPLALAVPPTSRMETFFRDLWRDINTVPALPRDLPRAAQTTCTYVKDYVFLYFPLFRPKHDGERSPLAIWGEDCSRRWLIWLPMLLVSSSVQEREADPAEHASGRWKPASRTGPVPRCSAMHSPAFSHDPAQIPATGCGGGSNSSGATSPASPGSCCWRSGGSPGCCRTAARLDGSCAVLV